MKLQKKTAFKCGCFKTKDISIYLILGMLKNIKINQYNHNTLFGEIVLDDKKRNFAA